MLGLCLQSCTKKLGYFHAAPFSKPLLHKVDKKLYVLIDDSIPDKLIVESVGLYSLQVKDYHNTIQSALSNALYNNFETVEFVKNIPDEGLVFALYRINAFWTRSGCQTCNSHQKQKEHTCVSKGGISNMEFVYDSSLILDGKKVKDIDGEVVADGFKMDMRFKNGFTKTIETINKRIVDDTVDALVSQ